MKRTAFRAASLLLIVSLLTAVAPLSAYSAAGGQAATKVVVEVVTATETVQKEFTNAQQMERLVDLCPGKSQLTNPTTVNHGGTYAKLTVHSGTSAKKTWTFYSDGCAIDSAGNWYATSREMYNLLIQLAGKNPDIYPYGDMAYTMTGNNPEVYPSFRGEKVTAFYTLDVANHSYNIAAGNDMIARLEKVPETKKLTGKTGFLVFTDKGRYAWYYAETKGNELLDFAAENNSIDVLRRPQWLVYMNPDKIESITFDSLGGKGFTLGSATKAYSISVATANRDSLDGIARFLKSVQVEPGAKRSSQSLNPSTPATLYSMRIKFNNGIEHFVTGYQSGMTIYDSDTKHTIAYETTEEQIKALRDFMSLLPEAKLAYLD